MRVSPPVVGRLLGVSRVYAHRRVVAGDFGKPQRRGRVYEVEIEAIEQRIGRAFTAEQIAAALHSNLEEVS